MKKYRIIHIPTGEFFNYEVECSTKHRITLADIQQIGCMRIGCMRIDCVYECDKCIWHIAKRVEFDVVRLYETT